MRLIFTIVSIFFGITQISAQISEGTASYYDDKFEGSPTANGEIFKQDKPTAAHRSLPFGTLIKVTNIQNKKSVVVTINDRGPFVDNRLIDVSKSVASTLGFIDEGMAKVKVEVVKTDEKKISEATTQPAQANDYVHFPNEYYELDIKFAKPAGFAIQVGSFSELANLMRTAQELRRIYGKNLLVQVTDVNNRKVHRLMVGPFPDRELAEKMLRNLKDDFTGSFVMELK